MGDMPNIQNLMPSGVLFCPVMEKRQFAAVTGLTFDTVEGMIQRGYLPCIRIGKRALINIALLQQRCVEAGLK